MSRWPNVPQRTRNQLRLAELFNYILGDATLGQDIAQCRLTLTPFEYRGRCIGLNYIGEDVTRAWYVDVGVGAACSFGFIFDCLVKYLTSKVLIKNVKIQSLTHFGVQFNAILPNKLLQPPVRNVHFRAEIGHAEVLGQIPGQVQCAIATDHGLGRANVFEALIVTRHFLLDVGRGWPICQ